MNLSDFIDLVCNEANVNRNILTVYNRVISETNRVCTDIWDGFRWSFRWRNYRIVTDVDVNAGTVTATNGSRTITGSGTAFLSTYKDWHISFDADPIQNWYKIRAFTSSTQLELDVPYQGTTGSSKKYTLRHFDYVLPTEPWDFGSVIVTHNRMPISILEPSSIDIIGPVPFYKGYPQAVSIYGSDPIPTIYSTGSISASSGTHVITGSGTSWLSNIYPGDLVGGTSNGFTFVYTVRSVDSDTQITVYNQLLSAISGGTSYTITRQFGRIMRIMWPSTDNYVLDIRALRKYVNLTTNPDSNELLYRYPDMIAKKVASLELKSQGDKRYQLMVDESDRALANAKADDDARTPREAIAPIYSYRTRSRNYHGDIR